MHQIPNWISAARLITAPYILYLLAQARWGTALVWLAISGISDGIDGYLARRWKATSELGAKLDPLGDKLLLSGSFLVLGVTGVIPAWLAGLVLGRDLIILMGVTALLAISGKPPGGLKFPPTWWGKWSTTAQIAYLLAVVAAEARYGSAWVTVPLQWTTAALTGISGLDYVQRGLRMRKSNSQGSGRA